MTLLPVLLVWLQATAASGEVAAMDAAREMEINGQACCCIT